MKEQSEKEWAKFFDLHEGRMTAGQEAVEAYKSALRAELEKRIPESPDTFDEYVIGTRAAMKTILELLDTVEP